MRKVVLSILSFVFAVAVAVPASGQILISEIADPGDEFAGRFVELYNYSNQTIDMAAENWVLEVQFNGGPNGADENLTGTLAPGEYYIVAKDETDFDNFYGFLPDQSNGSVVNSNGNEAYFLYQGGTGGTLIDQYGERNVDGSGEPWEFDDSQVERIQGPANSTFTLSEWNITTADVADMNPGSNPNEGSLPVELATFTAQVSGTQAQLQWETLSETNNAGFDIQHQAPQSSSFSSLGFVEGHGTTDTPQSYRFNTDALEAGTHTFRLRQIDLDGTDEIHEPVTVEVRQSDLMRLTGPNPVQAGTATELTIQPEQSDDVTVALYNVLGQRVQTLHSGRVSADDVLRLTLDTSNLSSGMYFVRADGNSVRQTKRITVVR